jgi:hypothetical protein
MMFATEVDTKTDEGSVSLPREWILEIKRMMTVYSTHG